MNTDSSNIWRWDAQLSWELFSEALYCYRQTMKSFPQHKTHMFCKNGLFAVITAVEAYVNETLLTSKNNPWSKTKIDKTDLEFKIKELAGTDINLNNFIHSKSIRNNYLVHHKRKDHRYVIEINPFSLLNAIESAQEIIAKIAFHNYLEFPYWISGINFINPLERNDINLLNEIEFWRHIITIGLLKCPDNFLTPSGSLNYPKQWEDYKILYDGLWQLLKNENFEMDTTIKDNRFPKMPYLSCLYWD